MHLKKRCTHTMGGLAPSLHRESTDSMILPPERCVLHIYVQCAAALISPCIIVYIYLYPRKPPTGVYMPETPAGWGLSR